MQLSRPSQLIPIGNLIQFIQLVKCNMSYHKQRSKFHFLIKGIPEDFRKKIKFLFRSSLVIGTHDIEFDRLLPNIFYCFMIRNFDEYGELIISWHHKCGFFMLFASLYQTINQVSGSVMVINPTNCTVPLPQSLHSWSFSVDH